MSHGSKFVLVASLAAMVTIGAGSALAGRGARRPFSQRIDLTNTGADITATGRLDLKHYPAAGRRADRTWFRFRVHRLDPDAAYLLWMDHPSTPTDHTLVQVDNVLIETSHIGGGSVRVDTKRGGKLPFDASIGELEFMAFELRSADGTAVLRGTFPGVAR